MLKHVPCLFPDSDKEDSVAESKTSGLIVAPKQMSSALGSLLSNYGSMSESESDEEPEGEFVTCCRTHCSRCNHCDCSESYFLYVFP